VRRWLLGALALLSMTGRPAFAASPVPVAIDLPAIKVRGDIRIGADPSAGEPYFWFAAAKASGFEAELGEAIAQKLGVKATFVQTPWRDLMAAVKAGRIDVAINALELRQDNDIMFSVPYYMASQAILVRTTEQRVYGLTDLAGRRVATTDGSVAAAILGKLRPAAVTRMFADTEAPFQDLAAGKSDAVLLESAMVRRHAMAEPKKFRLAGLPLLPRPYGAAMRKSGPLLVAGINAAIKDLQNSKEMARILRGYNLWDSIQAGAPATNTVAPVLSPTVAAVGLPMVAVGAKPLSTMLVKPAPPVIDNHPPIGVLAPVAASTLNPSAVGVVKPAPVGAAKPVRPGVPNRRVKPYALSAVKPLQGRGLQPGVKKVPFFGVLRPGQKPTLTSVPPGRARHRSRRHRIRRHNTPVPNPMPT
jgi:ABC-type amino acid transport substrate-binding protein